MNNAISESISQGEHRENASKRSRMEQVADELRRRCTLDESKPGDGESHRIGLYEEEAIAEAIAKEWNIWYSIDEVFAMGRPGPSGLGFKKTDDWTYTDGKIILSDLKPRNVLKDNEGNLFVIDVEIRSNQ